eukprot:scaffold326_cov169-Ochromonas_danica.AAC.3
MDTPALTPTTIKTANTSEDGSFSFENLKRLPTLYESLNGPHSKHPLMWSMDECDEYGHYDDCDQAFAMAEETPARSFSNDLAVSSSSIGSVSTSFANSSASTSASSLSSSSSDLAVLCVIESRAAPISCRSFDNVAVCMTMGGFRVVQEGYREEVEYKVTLTMDGKEMIAWKKFKDFRDLGEACQTYAHRLNKTRSGNPIFRNTIHAWQRVVRNRPWWSKPQCSMKYLCSEARLLGNFLKNVLFEVPSVGMLLEFVVN